VTVFAFYPLNESAVCRISGYDQSGYGGCRADPTCQIQIAFHRSDCSIIMTVNTSDIKERLDLLAVADIRCRENNIADWSVDAVLTRREQNRKDDY